MGPLGRGVKQRNIGWMSDEVLFQPEGCDCDSSKCLAPLDPAQPRWPLGQRGSAVVTGPSVLPVSGNRRLALGFPGPHPAIRASPSGVLALPCQNPREFFLTPLELVFTEW